MREKEEQFNIKKKETEIQYFKEMEPTGLQLNSPSTSHTHIVVEDGEKKTIKT